MAACYSPGWRRDLMLTQCCLHVDQMLARKTQAKRLQRPTSTGFPEAVLSAQATGGASGKQPARESLNMKSDWKHYAHSSVSWPTTFLSFSSGDYSTLFHRSLSCIIRA